jgi:hypothetical protein
MNLTLCDWHEPETVTQATYHMDIARTVPNSEVPPFSIDLCDTHFQEFMTFVDSKVAARRIRVFPKEGAPQDE